MPACTTCGEGLAQGARFCAACGARVLETAMALRKTITSLFCDLVGSTPLAETLADPEAIHEVLTLYLRAMTRSIERHGGAVEKFAGDAILGTFGAPVSHEDDALRAVRAAVDMQDALATLNEELDARWGVQLRIKIGINSGEVLTGDSIEGQAMALGDPVNAAARLEQTAGPGEIVIGETTARLIGAAAELDGPHLVPLKGKAEPMPSYKLVRLLAAAPDLSRSRPFHGRKAEYLAGHRGRLPAEWRAAGTPGCVSVRA